MKRKFWVVVGFPIRLYIAGILWLVGNMVLDRDVIKAAKEVFFRLDK